MTTFDTQKFRKDLLKKRIESGQLQTDCAKQIGIAASSLSRFERGVFMPDIVSLMACCDWLNKKPGVYFKNEK